MKSLVILFCMLVCIWGERNSYQTGVLNTVEEILVKKDNDQHIIFKTTEEDKNATLWNVSVKLSNTSCHVYFTIRQEGQVQSFQLPQDSGIERVTDICPFDVEEHSKLSIAMSTDCHLDVEVKVNVSLHHRANSQGWHVNPINETSVDVSKMTLEIGHPIVKYVATGNGTKKTPGSRFYKVDLSASQQSDCICSVVSIQKAACPYSDVLETPMRYGIWQTMMNQSTFVVDGKNYPNGFLIVVMASPSDKLCQIKKEENKCKNTTDPLSKNITITVKMNSSDSDYMVGILLVSIAYILLFVVILTISYIGFRYDLNSLVEFKDALLEVIPAMPYCSSEDDSPNTPLKLNKAMLSLGDNCGVPQFKATRSGTSGLKEALNSEEDKLGRMKKDNIDEVHSETTSIDSDDSKFRLKKDLRVSEMSKKLHNPMMKKSVYKKSKLYLYNLMLMSIFYCLPVLQMVMDSNSKIEQLGNQDLCYFNHLCQKPLGHLQDFNHVFSNLGYIFLGFLFIGVVNYKQRKFSQLSKEHQKSLGVPQQFGIFYAMGLALAMEGILSACYHVCPTTVSFQFDTTYMYLMAVLMQMKLYQSRHADISSSANPAFLCLGVALILEAISIYYHGTVFWFVFCLIYFIFTICFVTHAYHMGVIRQDKKFFLNIAERIFGELKSIYHMISSTEGKGCHAPSIRPRSIFLIITTLFNISLCLFFAIREEEHASQYLLFVFMGNMFAYTVYYVTMKMVKKEYLARDSWFYLVCGGVMGLPALYLFAHKEKSTELSAAESRSLNRDCIFLNFYDGHDVWHFLGGGGVFFMFMFLLTIDDNVKYKPTNQIYVF